MPSFTLAAAGGGFTLQPCTVIGGSSPSNVVYFAETPLSAAPVSAFGRCEIRWEHGRFVASVTVPNHGGFITGRRSRHLGNHPTLATRHAGKCLLAQWLDWFCHTAGGSSGKSRGLLLQCQPEQLSTGTLNGSANRGYFAGGSGDWTYQVSIGPIRVAMSARVFRIVGRPEPHDFRGDHAASASRLNTPVLIKRVRVFTTRALGRLREVTADPPMTVLGDARVG